MADLFDYTPLDRSQNIGVSLTSINTNFASIETAFDTVSSDLDQLSATVNEGVLFRTLVNTAASDGQTIFTTAYPYVLGSNSIIVTSGGQDQIKTVHYVETDVNTITFNDGRVGTEQVVVRQFLVGTGSALNTTGVSTTEETPTGSINSTDGVNGNGTFTVLHTIQPATVPEVIVSGFLRLSPYLHYSWSGSTITILPGFKPAVGETLLAVYQWS